MDTNLRAASVPDLNWCKCYLRRRLLVLVVAGAQKRDSKGYLKQG
jgi:hypothetical protein